MKKEISSYEIGLVVANGVAKDGTSEMYAISNTDLKNTITFDKVNKILGIIS